MNKKKFKKRKIARIEKELDELFELAEKSHLTEEQEKRMPILINQLNKLYGIPAIDVQKYWEIFQKNYLPEIEKFLQEHKDIGSLEIEQFLEELENKKEM